MAKTKTPNTCLTAAQNLLARREHSQTELRRKLIDKGFDKTEIEATLIELQQNNLQNNQRFAEAYTRMRSNHGFGPLRIKFELKERGIEDEIIEIIVDEDSDKWLEFAAKTRSKKFGETIPTNFEEQNKQIKFLIYKGFSFEQIRNLFSKS